MLVAPRADVGCSVPAPRAVKLGRLQSDLEVAKWEVVDCRQHRAAKLSPVPTSPKTRFGTNPRSLPTALGALAVAVLGSSRADGRTAAID